jgi:hypothetical protein
MKKIALVLLLPFFLTACVTPSTIDNCEGPPKKVTIHYGDSEIWLTPQIVNVKRQQELQFNLNPKRRPTDPVDYRDMKVTIKGKATEPDAAWINLGPESYKDNGGVMALCVPAGQATKTYRYLVNIEEVGELDPRAKVEL